LVESREAKSINTKGQLYVKQHFKRAKKFLKNEFKRVFATSNIKTYYKPIIA
jgi:alpha-mannosidase